MTDVTRILSAIEQGDQQASEQLLPLVYEELRRLATEKMAQEKPGQTLQATGLVHEAYLRLVNREQIRRWDSRGHFFSAAAEAMRRILVEKARRKRSLKGGWGRKRVALEASLAGDAGQAPRDDLLGLDAALAKFSAVEPVKAQIVKIHFFAGLTLPETAEVSRDLAGHCRTLLGLRTDLAVCRARRCQERIHSRESLICLRGLRAGFRIVDNDQPRRNLIMGHPTSLESIFSAALQKESAEERAAFVNEACAGNDDLRLQVERLLSAVPKVGSFLEGPLAPTEDEPGVDAERDAEAAATLPPRPISEGPGTRIGPYKLLQKIGEGGMGVVYMAEQEHPIRRRVALKIIKPGMDSALVIACFEAERQALAMMDYLNIARVLDAGTTESGRPYFVMELVHGVPITHYCDENKLSLKERLELFVPVCRAMQHAHQRGIIHRDVKPSNVLVTLYDGKPVPKVIDFGVAKAIEQKLTERTMFTQYGSIVGTLEYMAPEQAEMSGLGVDTRSDIYSLGVLLYELLTGTTPVEQKQVRELTYIQLLRMIQEDEPPKPSTRLSTTQQLATIASQRRTGPRELARLVRGELDWIVMKALEKDRTRRYENASGLARDVERFLNDEPVEAGPGAAVEELNYAGRRPGKAAHSRYTRTCNRS